MSEHPKRDKFGPMLSASAVGLCSVSNECWTTQSDPAERRRIQNRLNQRAFRQRQRSGLSPKQYRPRSESDGPSSVIEDDEETPSPMEEESPVLTQDRTCWDELAHLINRNLMAAGIANGRHLCINAETLQMATPYLTPRCRRTHCPEALKPVQLQHEIAHDPILDIIPHARFRFNVLRGISTGQLDSTAFSNCIRHSGALENVDGTWQRGGLLVWSTPDQLASWELSETFVREWRFLLQGCEDMVRLTNASRAQRGEKAFPCPLEN